MNLQAIRPAPIPALTGMRFIAALMVFVSHFPIPGAPSVVARIAQSGYVGVTFFFILSGFVLAYNHLDEFESCDRRSVAAYLIARFARVYPLYIFCILFAWISKGASTPIWQYLLTIQAWSSDVRVANGIVGPAWSVSVEMFLYACFPILVLIGHRIRIFHSPFLLAKTALLVLLAMFALAAYFMLIGKGTGEEAVFDPMSSHRWLYRMPPTRLLDFILGMAAASFVRSQLKHPQRLYIKLLPTLSWLAILIILAMMSSPALYYTAWSWDSAYAVPITVVIVSIALVRENWLAQFLSTKPLLLLGASSYAFYLIHTVMNPMLSPIARTTHAQISYIFFLFLVMSVSIGLHLSIEEPFRRKILMAFRHVKQ